MNQSNTRQILLGSRQGIQRFAIVDAEDYETFSAVKWCRLASGYAVRRENNKIVFMHRLIMDAPSGMVVDHINGDKLDNRRSNLRICTHRQNICNQKLSAANTSGYKGVTWNKNEQKWQAQIGVRVNGKKGMLHLGAFADPEEASAAYERAAREIFGDFVRSS